MSDRVGNIVMENAQIRFRNFSGKEGRFNPEGRRNFCVLLTDDIVDNLIRDGWNVKYLNPRDEDEAPQPYIQVAVNFDNIPPKVWLITSRGKTLLDEESVNMLDWAELQSVDLIIRPYQWEMNGKTGIKAYLKSGYFTIAEDEFESKYYDVPDSALNSFGDEYGD